MVIAKFPSVNKADKHGLLAVGGDLEVESLLLAYGSGIFPWPIDEETLAWFAPPRRAILLLDDFHRSASLKRAEKHSPFTTRIDAAFDKVITACAKSKNRKGQGGTWITHEMIEAYCTLHVAGFAHSIECFNGDRLVGGVYGVSLGGMFAAESMFYLEPNASKIALAYLVDLLRDRGVTWLDAQVMNPFLATLGFKEIPREDYMPMLKVALKKEAIF